MKEITGNLWDYHLRANHSICITTNGGVKADGKAIMGRGCAREAAQRIKGIDGTLGRLIKRYGNIFQYVECGVWAFPVKHRWQDFANPELICRSAVDLRKVATEKSGTTFVLPRPGCGNGGLRWEDVRTLLEDLPYNVWVISKEP